MRLEGSLDAFSLPDIFSLLSMTKKTGGLHLRRADMHGVVWLRDGLVTGGASDLSRLSLGRRIAGSGHVTDDALGSAVDAVRGADSEGLARVLRDSHAIDESDLHALVTEHLVDTVFDLMRWPDGSFEFVVDEANIDDVGVTREVDEVVSEARHRIEVWQTIDERLGTPASVISVALDPGDDASLRRDEWALLALVDGRRSVAELVSLCGRGQYDVVVALAELVGRGLLRVDDTSGVAAMLRRQELIATLENGNAVPAPAAPVAVATPDTNEIDAADVDVDLDAGGAEDAEAGVADADVEPDTEVEADTEVDAVSVVDTTPATEAVTASDADTAAGDEAGDAGGSEAGVDADDEHMAEIAALRHSTARAHDISSVVPQRSEPFRPSRQPDHPDQPQPMVAAMGGGGAVAAPAGVIERDPSVNKSLLLRLIAGVRGL